MRPKQLSDKIKSSSKNGSKKIRKSKTNIKNNLVRKTRKVKNTLEGKKDEVQNLLNQTSDQLNNSEIITPKKNLEKRSKALKKVQSLKKVVNNGYDHVENNSEEEKKAEEAPKNENSVKVSSMDISVDETAQEAASLNVKSGFLQRTISKLWKIPDGITGQVPYNDISSPEKEETQHSTVINCAGTSDSSSKCIIS